MKELFLYNRLAGVVFTSLDCQTLGMKYSIFSGLMKYVIWLY